MSRKPLSFRTRKGNRVFRAPYRYNGELRYAENYTFRIKKDGAQHNFNLGREKKKAETRSDQIKTFLSAPNAKVDDLYDNPAFDFLEKPVWHRPGANERGATRVPTVGELLARYQEASGDLSPFTIRNNCGALRHIAAFVLGLEKLNPQEVRTHGEKWRNKVDRLPLNRITRRHLEEFRVSTVKAAGQNGIKRGQAATTMNSYLRSARSLFAERLLVFYEDFELPEPNPFTQVSQMREPSHRYVSSLDVVDLLEKAKTRWWDGQLDKEEQAKATERDEAAKADARRRPKKTSDEIRRDERARFVVILLAATCGLRPKEIRNLLWDKVDLVERQLWIDVTAHDTPKAKNSERPVDFSAEVANALSQFRALCGSDPFVIPGGRAKKLRCGNLFLSINAWLRKKGIDDFKPLYTFRKEAGSMIFQVTGSIDKAADYLRNDPRVAHEHYVGRKERLELSFPSFNIAPAAD